ncbi:BadF/BadG/BcrA/BcrD ATPase family protein [Devosia rhodophyticola]|uniref:BadF/BadG/BcrA/BcrD ATPase family protein n=1 Tax=Devosia rhodophyticola TaxID=3026423 RepID=A0ABY7YUH0_9HYPH|nr:BadF/BadG/BcrA/BcrD ATPase family protein [Devosia rhodophyticola]WDR04753.1 BadF/BadG/BcrA/BcrD ATPase family protein [Devosia rhodophyticola]
MTPLILGIDGGGSKTQLNLVDRTGLVVHYGRVGGTNLADNPHWLEALETLLASTEPFRSDIVQAVVAIGGYRENPVLDRRVEDALKTLLVDIPTVIDNDVYVAHDAAFLGAGGVLLIAGTGSMAVSRSGAGTLTRTGGWGELFGDEGSAYWIGREALGLATRALDGRGQATRLVDDLPWRFAGAPEDRLAAIFEWIGALHHPRSQIAALAATTIAIAEDNDPVARSLIEAAVVHLSAHVHAGRRSGGFGTEGAWSMLGGLSASPLIRSGLERQLGPMVTPALPPCGGALWRASKLADWSIDTHWLAQLGQQLGAQTRQHSVPTTQFSNTGS